MTVKKTCNSVEAIKTLLEEQRRKLLQYCHHKECKLIYECPWEHKSCKEKLDLNTAIAWIAGYLISRILLDEAFIEDLHTHHSIFQYLYTIVHLHNTQYPLLHRLLEETLLLIKTFLRTKSAELKKSRTNIPIEIENMLQEFVEWLENLGFLQELTKEERELIEKRIKWRSRVFGERESI